MTVVPSPLRKIGRSARQLSRRLIDLVLPPRCIGCGETIGDPGALCGTCWSRLDFIGPVACQRCGTPLGEPGTCGQCLARPPLFDRARSALRYDEESKRLILAFKHADRTEAAPTLARLLHGAASPLMAGCDLMAPVPLHRWRLFRRRYNQAALLTHGLARLNPAGPRTVPDLLVRRRSTASQGELGRTARFRNLTGAIGVAPRHAALVAGRSVLLIDDVLTSGATAEACARALKRAGATHVHIATLARVANLDG